MSGAREIVLRLRNVSKSFEGVTVLDSISLDLACGEIHGLVGENGAGKSTLVKILSGYHSPDPGASADFNGSPLALPLIEPQRHGIGVVHQDLGLIDHLSVVENVGVGCRFGTRSGIFIRWAAERKRVSELLDRFGVDVAANEPVGELSPADKAMVAIVRTIREVEESGHDRHLLLLDEPTASLSASEVKRLFEMIRGVAASGSAVIFVSHRLREVIELCDRISVLRSGALVATLPSTEVTPQQLVQRMLGYDMSEFYPEKAENVCDDVLLHVDHARGSVVQDVSFSVHAGEILGVTGLAGMGQDELPYLVIGSGVAHGAKVMLGGSSTPTRLTPRSAIRQGVVLVAGDRSQGMWHDGLVYENWSLPRLSSYFSWPRLQRRQERHEAQAVMRRFRVRPPDINRIVATLSGGNQQKVVMARALCLGPKVLLLHDPTQGVDAGARKEILSIVADHVAGGAAAAVVFSSDYEELARTCHRILVLESGVISSSLIGEEVSEEAVLTACHAQPSGPADHRRSHQDDSVRRPRDMRRHNGAVGAPREGEGPTADAL